MRSLFSGTQKEKLPWSESIHKPTRKTEGKKRQGAPRNQRDHSRNRLQSSHFCLRLGRRRLSYVFWLWCRRNSLRSIVHFIDIAAEYDEEEEWQTEKPLNPKALPLKLHQRRPFFWQTVFHFWQNLQTFFAEDQMIFFQFFQCVTECFMGWKVIFYQASFCRSLQHRNWQKKEWKGLTTSLAYGMIKEKYHGIK